MARYAAQKMRSSSVAEERVAAVAAKGGAVAHHAAAFDRVVFDRLQLVETHYMHCDLGNGTSRPRRRLAMLRGTAPTQPPCT
jgi:hypothetical protein